MNPDSPDLDPAGFGDGITLVGYPWQVNLDTQTASIRWNLGGCGIYSDHHPGCGGCDRAVDLYSGSSLTPTFSYDPNVPTFASPVEDGLSVDHQIRGTNQPAAPFDAYDINVAVLAIDKATNKSTPIFFSVDSLVQNFNMNSYSQKCTRSNHTYDPGTGPITVEATSCLTVIIVKRSTLARAFTICLLIVNWALTSVSVWVTTIIYFKGEKPPDAVLLFPLTIVVTIPALRNLYVGSPPFGIFIDLIGFFLQMIIVAICSVFLFCFGIRAIINKPAQ